MLSITFHEKPAENTRRAISERIRSSGVAAISAGVREAVSANAAASPSAPPRRLAASAAISSNARIASPVVRHENK